MELRLLHPAKSAGAQLGLVPSQPPVHQLGPESTAITRLLAGAMWGGAVSRRTPAGHLPCRVIVEAIATAAWYQLQCCQSQLLEGPEHTTGWRSCKAQGQQTLLDSWESIDSWESESIDSLRQLKARYEGRLGAVGAACCQVQTMPSRTVLTRATSQLDLSARSLHWRKPLPWFLTAACGSSSADSGWGPCNPLVGTRYWFQVYVWQRGSRSGWLRPGGGVGARSCRMS